MKRKYLLVTLFCFYSFIKEKALIFNLDKNSVAAEDVRDRMYKPKIFVFKIFNFYLSFYIRIKLRSETY